MARGARFADDCALRRRLARLADGSHLVDGPAPRRWPVHTRSEKIAKPAVGFQVSGNNFHRTRLAGLREDSSSRRFGCSICKTPSQCCLSKTGHARRGIFWAHRAQRTAIMVENFGLRRRVPGGVDMRSKAKGASRKASATKGDKGRQRATKGCIKCHMRERRQRMPNKLDLANFAL